MTVRVAVSPAVLGWALDRTQDPQAVTESMPRVLQWLSGDAQPTLNQLTQFAARTGTPLGYFFLNQPPSLTLPVQDFREGHAGNALAAPSPDLMAVVNQSIRRQDWYRDYAQAEGLPEVSFVGEGKGLSHALAAAKMRRALSFEVEQRSGSWSDQRKHLIRAFEALGGLTVATSMVANNTHRLLDPDEFRGFSLVDSLAPLVFINTRQTINGQLFTLAHEFAHVSRGIGGVSLEDIRWQPQGTVERWCNAVASEFLVPQAYLAQSFPQVSHLPLNDQLDRLAQIFKCGTLVILQAIHQTGLRYFADFDAVYSAEVDRLRQLAGDHGDGGGGGQFVYSQPFRIGERLSRALIADTLAGRTTLHEAIRLTSLGSISNFDNYAQYLDRAD